MCYTQRALRYRIGQVVLSAVMLRRTKTTLVNGKPILELPDRLVEIVDCPFDLGERAFYDKVNELVQNRLETLQQQGGVAKNYTSMLMLLLRLRQGTYHLLRVVCVVIDHELGQRATIRRWSRRTTGRTKKRWSRK